MKFLIILLEKVARVLLNTWACIVYRSIYRTKLLNFKNIPVIINNRNRYTTVKFLVTWLQRNGYRNIYIIDNNSGYKPLLDYYTEISCKVIRLKKNIGHLALWRISLYWKICWNFYIYTDPDILPVDECPHDVVLHFLQKLNDVKGLAKIGFSLIIDDIPNYYGLKRQVIDWESQFWIREIGEGLYKAKIDTTFALYKPFTRPRAGMAGEMAACRTGMPYSARHLPWYVNMDALSEEETYYINNASTSSASWLKSYLSKNSGPGE